MQLRRAISDGNIRYFEYQNDKFEFLSEHKSLEPQRGIAFVPKRGINVSCCILFVVTSSKLNIC